MSDDAGWFRRFMGESNVVTELKAALEHQSARVTELTVDLEEAEQREAARTIAVAELNERLETLQTIVEACQDEQTRAAAHIATLEGELSQARAQLADERKKLLAASSQAATLQKRLAEAADRDAEHLRDQKALEASLADAQKDQLTLQQRAQELDRELEHQSEQIEAVTLELAESAMGRQQAEARVAAQAQELGALEARLVEETQLKDTAIRGRGRVTRELEEKTRELEEDAERHLAERAEWLGLLQGLWEALQRTLGPVTSLALERSLRGHPPALSRPGDGLGARVEALSQWLGARQLCRSLSARETSGGFELRLEPAASPSETPGWLAPVIVQWLAQSMQTRYRAAAVRWTDSAGTIAVERHPSA